MNDQAIQQDPIDQRLRQYAISSSRGVGAILTAWTLSIVLHGAGLGLMLLVVFPFAAGPAEPELPRINAQVIGDIDATPSPLPPSPGTSVASVLGPTPTRFQPDKSGIDDVRRVAPSTATSDLSVIGIGPSGAATGGYGLSLEGGAGNAEFFGAGGAVQGVRRIVYVVDRSGSMVDTFQRVRTELRRSVSNLRRSQKFHVIFFNASDPLESPPQKLVNAIDSYKQQFFTFLEGVNPGGGTKPERALKRALALEPDILYLLSDGINFDPELMNKLNDWNRERKTRIFTIAYLDPTGRQLLEAIAREHGGEFRFVSDDDLP